jgi:hypothetical protein
MNSEIVGLFFILRSKFERYRQYNIKKILRCNFMKHILTLGRDEFRNCRIVFYLEGLIREVEAIQHKKKSCGAGSWS